MTSARILWLGFAATSLLSASVINTTDAGTVAAFQSGATVVTFESISGVTPMAIDAYTNGVPVTAGATLFNEVPGVQFSVGGNPGTFETSPVVFQLGTAIQDDAASGTNVLGPADMQGNTNFGAFIEVYFPTKVDKVGFWINPSLGPVTVIAKTTQFAFSGETEDPINDPENPILAAAAGHFVGFSRPTADIGGLTILSANTDLGFTIDDLTFHAGTTVSEVPEPGSFGLCLAGGIAALLGRKLRRRSA